MNNHGFIVENDRFHLENASCYLLNGWLVPDTELKAFLGKQELSVKTELLGSHVNREYKGVKCRVSVSLPEELPRGKSLKLYACRLQRKLCFVISSEELKEKRQGIQFFLDFAGIDAGKKGYRIEGWCVAKEPVQIAVADSGKNKLSCSIQRTGRKDLVHLFQEYPIEERCGFRIELPLEAGNRVYLLMKTRDAQLAEAVELSGVFRQKERVFRKMQKGVRYFQYNGTREFLKKSFPRVFDRNQGPLSYHEWMKNQVPDKKERKRQQAFCFSSRPKISIVIPLYNTPEIYLKEILDSITSQTYSNWELCLADGSTEDRVETYIRTHYAKDERIRYQRLKENRGISENTNAALEMASGDYIMLSDHDDIVVQGALYEIARAISQNPELDILYTDEDKISMDGKLYFDPNFKSDFNPFMMECNNYVCHIFVVRASIIKKIGGFRSEYDGAQDYDLILRCWEETSLEKICHIPKILYHWRCHPNSTAANPESKGYAFTAGKKALDDHFQRIGVKARAELTENLGIYRIHREVEGNPKVSIIIPNKDHIQDLDQCLTSVTANTSYSNYEILVVENNSTREETFAYYKEMEKRFPNCRLLVWKGEFNYAAINNYAAARARGEYLLFLNNDMELITPDWIQELLGVCQNPQVGIVGARLFYPDDTVQHAGVILGLGGVAGHIFSGISRYDPGYMGHAWMPQNLSAVTAACMLMRRKVFEEVQGFDEAFRVAFNDVDLCMKTTAAGYQVVYMPYAQLYHYESKSRGLEDTEEKLQRFHGEVLLFEKKWGDILEKGDPYYNCNLSLKNGNCTLRDADGRE